MAVGQTPESFYEAGDRYSREYKFDSAVIMFQLAKRNFTPGTRGELNACNELGDIFKYDLHDFEKAEVNYERALTIQQHLNPSGTKELTRIYYNLATTNRSQHDYATAITWCLKAVDGCLLMHDDGFLELTYTIAGNIYRDRHQFDSAVVYYQRGIDVNKKLHKGKENDLLAALYVGWGETNYKQGDLDAAAKKLSYAVSIYRKLENIDKSIYFYTVRLLAEVKIHHNELDAAEVLLAEANKIISEQKSGGQVSSLHKTYGDLFAAKKNKDLALQHYDKALEAAWQLSDFSYEALLGKAKILTGKEALECYSNAEKLMMANRAELDTEDAKWSYIDANYRLYENILNTIYNLKSDETSLFHFMENSKAKSLADALHEAELKKSAGKNDTLLSALQNLRQRSLFIQHQSNEKNNAASRDELISITQKISVLEDSINLKYPSYIKTRYENTIVPLDDLKSKIKNIDAVFIEYFLGYENSYALVVSQDTTQLYSIKNVDRLSLEYIHFFTTRTNQYSPEAVKKFASVSYELYSALLRPFENHLKHKRLIIVPDGVLMQLPFETLITHPDGDSYKDLSYLVNDHIISYDFSASHLLANTKPVISSPSILALGAELAGSQTELIALSSKFPKGTFLYGNEVTEKSFKDVAFRYDVLHLAVHGSGDTGQDYSATLYFHDKDGSEDGKLYWYELYNMNLKASLAVLSSCESGVGKTYRGEGMLSMANAFTFAGCSNIVMGLWKVDDQISVKLMDTFYGELLNGMAIDEALAIAKRTYLVSADQVSANPKLWGSLVAYGQTPILRADEIPTSWVVIALSVLAAAIFVLIVKTRKK